MKKSRTSTKNKYHQKQIEWLPFDSRLIPDIFQFGNVRGISRIFLIIEMFFSTIVVICTLVLVLIYCIGK